MARKSLNLIVTPQAPTQSRSNGNKRDSVATPSSSARPAKRRRTRAGEEAVEVAPADEEPAKEETSGEAPVTAPEEVKEPAAPAEIDPEKELEAWHEFAADHYEMVEQLPLELHRNFRLLRELDDGCTIQTDKLQALIREYIGLRLPKRDLDADQDTTTLEIQSEAKEGTTSNIPEQSVRQTPPRPSVEGVPDIISENGPAAEALGVPLPDGQGGLLLPARIGLVEDDWPTSDRNHFPSTPGKSTPGGIEGDSTDQNGAVDANLSPSGQRKVPGQEDDAGPSKPSRARGEQSASAGRPSDLLPSIGRLVKDLVRNGEEKVAVAIGAYNAIDRHIRALDSALSTQEASILLGLRVDTNPSTAVDVSLNLPTDENAVPVEEEGDVIIGLGGGGARRKKGRGRGRKNNKKEPEPVLSAAEANGWIVIPSDVDIDPNEPRYCYCNQVSCGQMIGCENEECPHEWFHLPCVGMTTPPTGKWWCNTCKPKVGLGMGGAGTAAPSKVAMRQKKPKPKARR